MIETNSSIQAGVAARPTLPNSQDDAFPTKKMREKKPQLSTYPAQLRRFFGCHSPSVAVPERGAAASAQLPPLRCSHRCDVAAHGRTPSPSAFAWHPAGVTANVLCYNVA
ncbi:MAG: hypothetical protein WA177_07235 [Xanthobacteraceae bacterium]